MPQEFSLWLSDQVSSQVGLLSITYSRYFWVFMFLFDCYDSFDLLVALRYSGITEPKEIVLLSIDPKGIVGPYERSFTNVFRFHSKECEMNKKTHNNRVIVSA